MKQMKFKKDKVVETIDTYGDYGEIAGKATRKALSKANKVFIACTIGTACALLALVSGFILGLFNKKSFEV